MAIKIVLPYRAIFYAKLSADLELTIKSTISHIRKEINTSTSIGNFFHNYKLLPAFSLATTSLTN